MIDYRRNCSNPHAQIKSAYVGGLQDQLIDLPNIGTQPLFVELKRLTLENGARA